MLLKIVGFFIKHFGRCIWNAGMRRKYKTIKRAEVQMHSSAIGVYDLPVKRQMDYISSKFYNMFKV